MENKIMLITYPDSLGGNLRTLEKALSRFFSREVGLVHILPFFPSSGDRGFAPITYDKVEEAFGDWTDIRRLGEQYGLMSDFMINHISRRSPQFLDYQKNRDASPYRELFLNWTRFWGGEPSREEADRIYKRKDRDPYVEIPFADGSAEKIWCTFSEEQLDLDLRSEAAWDFVRESMERMAENGIRIIRLDAFVYAVKKRGGSCFFEEPEIWDLLGRVDAIAKELGAELLPEMHEHYSIQLKIADHGYWVYDFALPMLTLYALYKGDGTRLKHWLSICPRRQFTTLDTHDGIGVVDVKDLMTDAEMEEAVDLLFEKGAKILPLILSDGRVLRCGGIGVPTADCLFEDPVNTKAPLKLWNSGEGFTAVAAFHISRDETAVSGSLGADDVPALAGKTLWCWDWETRRACLLRPGERMQFTLDSGAARLYLLIPAEEETVPLGLVEKYLAPAAIHHVEQKDGAVCVQLAEPGIFGFLSGREPSGVTADGKAAAWKVNGSYYELEKPAQEVCISFAEGQM